MEHNRRQFFPGLESESVTLSSILRLLITGAEQRVTQRLNW